jgi:hypothetical protein
MHAERQPLCDNAVLFIIKIAVFRLVYISQCMVVTEQVCIREDIFVPGNFRKILLPETRKKAVPYLLRIFPVAIQFAGKHLLFAKDSCHEKNGQGKSSEDPIP